MKLNIKRYLDFTYSLVSVMDLDELMEISLKKLRNLLNADAGSIFIYSEEDKRLIFKYTQNETIDIPFKEFSIPLDETSIAGYSGKRREIVRIDDVRDISCFPFGKALSILKNEAEDGKLDKKLVDFFVQKEIYSCFQEG